MSATKHNCVQAAANEKGGGKGGDYGFVCSGSSTECKEDPGYQWAHQGLDTVFPTQDEGDYRSIPTRDDVDYWSTYYGSTE